MLHLEKQENGAEILRNEQSDVCGIDGLNESDRSVHSAKTDELNAENESIELNKRIALLFRKIGIPANIKGYRYAVHAIGLVYGDAKYLEGITKRLYPDVAKKYDTTSSRVERAIRHAIEVSWTRGDLGILEKLFGSTMNQDTGKLTNSEFIAGIAEILKNEEDLNI